MATTIVTKNSSTASAVPTAAQLVQGELAVNVADKRIYTENNAGAVVELGTNPSSLTVSGNIDVDGTTNLDVVDIDGAVDMASTLTVAGEITANGGIALGDNDKATFGASDDLEIYHSGSHSFISDVGTGNLYLQAADSIILRTAGVNISATFTPTAGVDLNYTGSTKLATTATGIDVTGTATMDGLVVDGNATISNATNPKLEITDTTVPNTLRLQALNGDSLIGTTTATSLLIKTSDTTRASFSPAGNFSLYEDTGTTAKFFWDASAEKLNLTGVGGLDVTGTATLDGLVVENAAGATLNINTALQATDSKILLHEGTTVSPSNGASIRYDGAANLFKIGVGTSVDTTRLSIDRNTGDISFYEDTGTTAKLFWDASFERLSIDSNTVNPLVISRNGGTDANVSIKFDCATSDYYVGTNPANNFGIGIASDLTSAPFQINASGNVGIGTAAPSAKLDVELGVDGVIAEFRGGDADLIQIKGASNTIALDTRNTAALTFEMQGTERMRIDSAGNVGIGTSTPQTSLSIETSGTQNVVSPVVTGQTAGVTYGGLYTVRDGAGDQRGLALNVYTANVGLNEAMRIDSAGNVLIGTSTAGASKLVVNDDSIQVNTAKTPASASATGTTGEIAWDANYVYVCVSTNTWKRSALSTW